MRRRNGCRGWCIGGQGKPGLRAGYAIDGQPMRLLKSAHDGFRAWPKAPVGNERRKAGGVRVGDPAVQPALELYDVRPR